MQAEGPRGRGEQLAALVLIAAGAGLRLWQYIGRDSLFLDEMAILRNVVGRSWCGLVGGPLDYDQLAPPAFLLTEKLAITLGGTGEYSARLFPLLCALVAVPAFAALARRHLGWPAAAAALLMFVTAGPLIYFGAQIKQYSTDVLGTCVLLLLATRYTTRRDPRDATLLALAAAALVWFSQPAVLVLGGIAAVLGLEEARRERRERLKLDKQLLVGTSLAGLSAVASVPVARHRLTVSGAEFMHRFWAEGFPPESAGGWIDRPWPFAQTLELFGTRWSNSFGYPAPLLFVLVLAAGLVLLCLRGPAGRLVVAPVLVAVAACGAGQYPFSSRLVYFLLPCFFLAIASALERVASALGSSRAASAVAPGVALVASFPVLTTLPTYHRDHLRPVVEHLAAERRPGDELYVYYGAAPAFWYYAPALGLDDASLVPGLCHRGDPRQYLRELDALRGGTRSFVVIAHAERGERDDILRYLDAIGTRRAEFRGADHWYFRDDTAPEVFEYSLSDADKLGRALADTFPLRPYRRDPTVPCTHGPISMPHERMTP